MKIKITILTSLLCAPVLGIDIDVGLSIDESHTIEGTLAARELNQRLDEAQNNRKWQDKLKAMNSLSEGLHYLLTLPKSEKDQKIFGFKYFAQAFSIKEEKAWKRLAKHLFKLSPHDAISTFFELAQDLQRDVSLRLKAVALLVKFNTLLQLVLTLQTLSHDISFFKPGKVLQKALGEMRDHFGLKSAKDFCCALGKDANMKITEKNISREVLSQLGNYTPDHLQDALDIAQLGWEIGQENSTSLSLDEILVLANAYALFHPSQLEAFLLERFMASMAPNSLGPYFTKTYETSTNSLLLADALEKFGCPSAQEAYALMVSHAGLAFSIRRRALTRLSFLSQDKAQLALLSMIENESAQFSFEFTEPELSQLSLFSMIETQSDKVLFEVKALPELNCLALLKNHDMKFYFEVDALSESVFFSILKNSSVKPYPKVKALSQVVSCSLSQKAQLRLDIYLSLDKEARQAWHEHFLKEILDGFNPHQPSDAWIWPRIHMLDIALSGLSMPDFKKSDPVKAFLSDVFNSSSAPSHLNKGEGIEQLDSQAPQQTPGLHRSVIEWIGMKMTDAKEHSDMPFDKSDLNLFDQLGAYPALSEHLDLSRELQKFYLKIFLNAKSIPRGVHYHEEFSPSSRNYAHEAKRRLQVLNPAFTDNWLWVETLMHAGLGLYYRVQVAE